MPIKIIAFGRLKDITGNGDILLDDAADTNQLLQQLNKKFPALTATPFIVAVDKEIITGNTDLSGADTVALLPPYSGG